jgi:hypothetical protein
MLPPGANHWSPEAAALLEENERILQSLPTLEAILTSTWTSSGSLLPEQPLNTKRRLSYARPNRMRLSTWDQAAAQGKGKWVDERVSDGWLEWGFYWGSYACGFSFPDSRGLNVAPLAGFFASGRSPDPWATVSYAEQVRRSLRRKSLRGLRLERLPRGIRRVQWDESINAVYWVDFDAQSLPVETQRRVINWRTVPQKLWELVPPPVPGAWHFWQETQRVQVRRPREPLPPETFVAVVPAGARPTQETARYQRLFMGFMGLRDGLLPE